MKISQVLVTPKILQYIKTRNIEKQYFKAKYFLLEGNIKAVALKLRKPKKDGIFQFRITKKYRAFAEFRDDILVISEISDHQK